MQLRQGVSAPIALISARPGCLQLTFCVLSRSEQRSCAAAGSHGADLFVSIAVQFHVDSVFKRLNSTYTWTYLPCLLACVLKLPLHTAFNPPYNLIGNSVFAQVAQAPSCTVVISLGKQRAPRNEGLLRSSRSGTPCPRGAAAAGSAGDATAEWRAFPRWENASPRGRPAGRHEADAAAPGRLGRASRRACRPPPRSVLVPRNSAARPGARRGGGAVRDRARIARPPPARQRLPRANRPTAARAPAQPSPAQRPAATRHRGAPAAPRALAAGPLGGASRSLAGSERRGESPERRRGLGRERRLRCRAGTCSGCRAVPRSAETRNGKGRERQRRAGGGGHH